MIDVHTHYMLPEHWGNEFSRNWAAADHYTAEWPTITPQDFDRDMAAAGIHAALVFGITARRAGVFTPFEEVADFCTRATTTTYPFVALDLIDADLVDQLDDAVQRGARGVKLYPVLSGHDPRDPQLDRFYDLLVTQSLVVMWHMGTSPSAAADLRLGQPMLVDEVAQRHPNLVQIIAHMAHPWQREAIIVTRKQPNVFLDISAQWQRPLEGYLALTRATEWGVVNKLLFGSDYPLWTPADAIERMRELSSIRPFGLPSIGSAVEQIYATDALSAIGLA